VLVEFFGGVQEIYGLVFRQRFQKRRDRMAPGDTAKLLVDGFDRFFGPLLSGKTSPFIVFRISRPARVFQVALRLFEPVLVSACHRIV
jgi:hypothetical protein